MIQNKVPSYDDQDEIHTLKSPEKNPPVELQPYSQVETVENDNIEYNSDDELLLFGEIKVV